MQTMVWVRGGGGVSSVGEGRAEDGGRVCWEGGGGRGGTDHCAFGEGGGGGGCGSGFGLVGDEGGALAGGQEEGEGGEEEVEGRGGGAMGLSDFHAVRLRLDRTDAVDRNVHGRCGWKYVERLRRGMEGKRGL